MKIKCPHCGKVSDKPAGAVNRARADGLRIFCNRRCAGLARRKHKTKAQKVAEKRAYDVEYRRKNLVMIKARKKEYFQRTYDPASAAIERKKRMKFHVEYCRQPSYKLWKKEYDRRRRDAEYGPWADAASLTIDLNREIKERASNEQIRWENKTANKVQFRRRAEKAPERTRPRGRDRRDAHSFAVGR
jgi:hypothetical protein